MKNILRGFTLIEVLLVIAILAILAAIVIVAINPGKQFAEAQNAQRRNDVRSILEAVYQYSVDNYGSYPGDIVLGADCDDGADICRSGMSCDGVNLDSLIEEQKYLVDIPSDPVSATEQLTGYKIYKHNTSGRIGVCAPDAAGDAVISVTQ
jgi:type IV pilus assembly protein PilA